MTRLCRNALNSRLTLHGNLTNFNVIAFVEFQELSGAQIYAMDLYKKE